MKRIIKKLLKSLGIRFSIYRDEGRALGCDREDEVLESVSKIQKNTMLTYPRLASLYNQVVFCEQRSIPGSYVECGVWKGGAVGLMALGNLRHGSERRTLHLFDAFDDICEPDENIDGKRAIEELKDLGYKNNASGRLIPVKGLYQSIGGHGTIGECEELLFSKIGYPANKVTFHKGWFQNILPVDSTTIGSIAILRIDGDWYASTRVCLENLFDKVVPGGFVIIDDYGHYEGCKKAVDEFIHERRIRSYLNYVDYSCRYWIKQTET